MFALGWKILTRHHQIAHRHGRPSVIIASSPHPYTFLSAWWLARKYKAKCVFEVRDIWPLSMVELGGVSAWHPMVLLTGRLERFAYRRSDAVVSLLPAAAPHMIARGLEPERFRYIPNGVDLSNMPRSWTEEPECVTLARFWRTQGYCVVVYAGALGRPNHVTTLIRAIIELRSKGYDKVRAIIVGRGEEKDELKSLITSNALEETVALFGQVPKVDVQSLLADASIGYISLRPEPILRFGVSPNKLFDYMLAALPVIFAVRAGNDPVAEAGCGISVDPGDVPAIAAALRELSSLQDIDLAALGQNGKAYVERRHGYDQLAAAYRELLNPHGPSPDPPRASCGS
ncbi:glycosyltransferase involved in cell wall biosynthesis [Rhizobium sp. BK418]|nr:glycosyltransferase involved in cell wall biosynthesis [Rhizobium sp. BK418]